MIKMIATLAALTLAGCASPSTGKIASTQHDLSGCKAVQGGFPKQDSRGRLLYQYKCDGQSVWSLK